MLLPSAATGPAQLDLVSSPIVTVPGFLGPLGSAAAGPGSNSSAAPTTSAAVPSAAPLGATAAVTAQAMALPAVDKLAAPLAANAAFRTAVHSADPNNAAVAAVRFILEHYHQLLQEMQDKMEMGQATTSSGGKDFSVGHRVFVASNSKRVPGVAEFIGSIGTVTRVELSGWVVVTFQDGRELRIQQQCLVHASDADTLDTAMDTSPNTGALAAVDGVSDVLVPPTGAALAASLANFPPIPDNLHGLLGTDAELMLDAPSAQQRSSARIANAPPPDYRAAHNAETQPSKYHQSRTPMLVGRAVTKMREMVRTVRKEVLSFEENIPWGAVEQGWRAARSGWRRALRAAEGVQEVAQAMLELHLALLTDRAHGLFQAGGHWERGIQECAAGKSGYQALQQLWGDMREEVNAWMAGGMEWPQQEAPAEEPVSAEAAARAAAALEAAGQRGAPYITQVPLTGILNSSKENFLALRSLVERERHKVLSQIDAIAAGGGPEEQAALAAMLEALQRDAAVAGYADSMFGGLPLHEGMEAEMKLQLGGADMDTDADEGSEVTDLEEDDA